MAHLGQPVGCYTEQTMDHDRAAPPGQALERYASRYGPLVALLAASPSDPSPEWVRPLERLSPADLQAVAAALALLAEAAHTLRRATPPSDGAAWP